MLPFPLPDKYKNDGDSLLPRDALKAVGEYRFLLRRFGPDRDEDEDQLKRATDVARGIRLAWSNEGDLELAEVPLAKDFKLPTDEDFARLEQWLLTATNATKKETAKYEAAAGNSQDGGKSSNPAESARKIALNVDRLFIRNRYFFLSSIEVFKQEAAARKVREKDAERVSDEADRAILDELDAIKAGNATPSLTDKQKRPGPGWEWQAVFPGDKDGDPVPHMVEGWKPPEALRAEAILAKKHDYAPGPNPTAATMVTLLAALHDERLPNSPAILDTASGQTLSAVQDPGLFALYGARMWCIAPMRGDTDRLDALETYLNHVEAAIAEVQTAKPETTTPAAKTPEERARQIALKVDRLYHGNPARWQEQWAVAVAEAEEWHAREQETAKRRQEALDAVWREVRAVEVGTAKARLTNEATSPGEGWRWKWLKISDPADRLRTDHVYAWMPPEAAIDPKCWPRPTPSLAAQYLILAVFHDTVLPKGSAPIMDARTAESGAVGYIEG